MSECIHNGGVSSDSSTQFDAWSHEIWTDYKALTTAYADAWATIAGHKEHSLCFKTLQRAQPDMTWTKSHPEKITSVKEDWTRDEWGNHLAYRMAGTELTHWRAVHFRVTARDALLS